MGSGRTHAAGSGSGHVIRHAGQERTGPGMLGCMFQPDGAFHEAGGRPFRSRRDRHRRERRVFVISWVKRDCLSCNRDWDSDPARQSRRKLSSFRRFLCRRVCLPVADPASLRRSVRSAHARTAARSIRNRSVLALDLPIWMQHDTKLTARRLTVSFASALSRMLRHFVARK
jgi:hypothetical protein